MSLRATFGYPIGVAAVVVGVLRQTQRWLPRYELITANQLGYYIAAINLIALSVGAVGVFALGVRADRKLGHRWTVSTAMSTAVVAAVAGLAVGTAVTVSVQPGHNTITTPLVGFVAPLAIYTITQGVPIGLAGLAGLATSRIYAIERTEAAMATESAHSESTESSKSTTRDTESDANRRQSAESDSESLPRFEL